LKYKTNLSLLFASLLLLCSSVIHAEQLIMARTNQSFPEAMSKLQETIISLNYKVSRVQRIDIGLTKSGFLTDKYRVVFFGKQKEVDTIVKKYPHLIPYIPWKIAIFAEQDDTLLMTANPMRFSNEKFPGADKYLSQWSEDIEKIFEELRESE